MLPLHHGNSQARYREEENLKEGGLIIGQKQKTTYKLLNEKDTSWLDYWAIIFWQGLLE